VTLAPRFVATLGSVLFFIVAPGVVAGLIPWLITKWEAQPIPALIRFLGGAVVVVGIAALVSSFGKFVVEGIGTPAPVAQTEHLVLGGLYRYVRNPMYVAVLAIIVGQAALLGRRSLIWYALVAGGTMAAFARFYEEPSLVERFGESYENYRRNVPGWWPRLTPWDGKTRR
jgi:protein-S-isoprenylcysteine O-methyltransferase Ste14